MSTYAIGDLQGCFKELEDLLDKINFDQTNDCLWFAGDLINRGPQSLGCLRFVKSLEKSAKMTLGNHDLHLLTVAYNARKPHKKDTLDEILNADDSNELINWVRQQPLIVHDTELNFTMVHAGIPPQWSLEQAKELAKETESVLQGKPFNEFVYNMYGDQPDLWSESLKDDDRHRYIINSFTRMRYCDTDGKLNLEEKSTPGSQPDSLQPWYAFQNRKTKNEKILFGHWSTVTLNKDSSFNQYNVYPLDTGCLWGGELTAIRLEDETIFSVPSRQPKIKLKK